MAAERFAQFVEFVKWRSIYFDTFVFTNWCKPAFFFGGPSKLPYLTSELSMNCQFNSANLLPSRLTLDRLLFILFPGIFLSAVRLKRTISGDYLEPNNFTI